MNVPGSEAAFLQEVQDRSFAAASEATRSSYPPERRMTGPEAADYLSRRRFAVVATVRSSGQPHASLSAFLFSGDSFWLPAMAGTARERNVRAGGYVSLAVAEGDDTDHKAVLAEGPAEVLSELEKPVISTWTERHGKLPDWATAWIRLRPSKVFSYDAGLPEHELVGWRCEACGDTYTAHTGQAPLCPSCGSGSARPATEPFL